MYKVGRATCSNCSRELSSAGWEVLPFEYLEDNLDADLPSYEWRICLCGQPVRMEIDDSEGYAPIQREVCEECEGEGEVLGTWGKSYECMMCDGSGVMETEIDYAG